MTEPRLWTFAERPDLMDRLGDVMKTSWPEFMMHGNVAKELWRGLRDRSLDLQWVLHDEDADEVVGLANSIPLFWDGDVEHLPDGFDAVLQRAFGSTPTVFGRTRSPRCRRRWRCTVAVRA